MILSLALFLIGFYILIKGANILVDASSSLAQKLNVSGLVIGLLIAGIGTSIPEFAVFNIANFTDQSDIGLGTTIGSNTFNILFILGLSALFFPITFKPAWIKRDLIWNIIAILAIVLLISLPPGGELSRIDGLLLLAIFGYWLRMVIKHSNGEEPTKPKSLRIIALPLAGIMILAGLVGIIIGGKWVVDGAVAMAEFLGLNEALISLIIVGVGTSLPEFAVTFIAAFKKQPGIAVGNIIGSNIFDFLMIFGAGALIRPFSFPSTLTVDILVTVLAAAILLGFTYIGGRMRLGRWQGLAMVVIYLIYVVYIAVRV